MKMSHDFFMKYIFSLFFVISFLFLLVGDTFLNKKAFLLADFKDPSKAEDIHSSFDDENDSDFPTNPLELLNVLRQIESINNRSSPSDAIEDALKAFENEAQQESLIMDDF